MPRTQLARLIDAAKDVIRDYGIVMEALTADEKNRDWVAPELWEEMLASRNSIRRLLLAALDRPEDEKAKCWCCQETIIENPIPFVVRGQSFFIHQSCFDLADKQRSQFEEFLNLQPWG